MGLVGKCVSKENPKSDLDLDLGFVNKFLFPIGRLTHILSSFQLGLRLMVC